jgi:transcriptional regulator with XRE-family HTH domain
MNSKKYNKELLFSLKNKGLTYHALAEKTGLHFVKIHRIVTGKAIPSPDERRVICNVLRQPQKELFRDYI